MICRAACGHRWPADDPEWLAQVLPVGRAHRIWPAQGDDIEWTRNSMAPHDEAPTEFAACAMTLCLQSSRKVRHTVADLVLLGPQDRPTGPWRYQFWCSASGPLDPAVPALAVVVPPGQPRCSCKATARQQRRRNSTAPEGWPSPETAACLSSAPSASESG